MVIPSYDSIGKQVARRKGHSSISTPTPSVMNDVAVLERGQQLIHCQWQARAVCAVVATIDSIAGWMISSINFALSSVFFKILQHCLKENAPIPLSGFFRRPTAGKNLQTAGILDLIYNKLAFFNILFDLCQYFLYNLSQIIFFTIYFKFIA